MDQIIRQVALRWHPEWRKRDLWGRLTEEEERHMLTHRLAESLLCHDRVLASIADEAEENGVDGHEVRHCLARAALSKMWDFHHDEAQFAEQDMDERFKAELRNAAMIVGESQDERNSLFHSIT